jgi:cbb3-type cytochrome oxidase cytochrome c subunit
MNQGPFLFLAAFFALASSWFAFVLTPQAQTGRLQRTNTLGVAALYPVARPGLARRGLEFYRANGCAHCHSQQIGQTATLCNVMLTDPGTNQGTLLAALIKVNTNWAEAGAQAWLGAKPLPQLVLQGLKRTDADTAAKTLTTNGAKAAVWIVPVGPDIARGWGKRRSVAEDFLYDCPVMLGAQRIGPDLANVGARLPDPNWHLRHLYAPQQEVKRSLMPPYRFLFEKRKLKEHQARSPDALVWPDKSDPALGWEILPKPEARALAAYLLSLHADAPLFDAPLTVPPVASAAPATNAPAAADTGATNAPPPTPPSTNTTTTANTATK